MKDSPPVGAIERLIVSDSPKSSLNWLDWMKSLCMGAISSASVYLVGAVYVVVHSGAAYLFLDYLKLHSTSLIKDPYFAITVAGLCTITTDLLHRYFDGAKNGNHEKAVRDHAGTGTCVDPNPDGNHPDSDRLLLDREEAL